MIGWEQECSIEQDSFHSCDSREIRSPFQIRCIVKKEFSAKFQAFPPIFHLIEAGENDEDGFEPVVLKRFKHVSPFTSGMRRSSVTTSGLRPRIKLRAAAPVSAKPKNLHKRESGNQSREGGPDGGGIIRRSDPGPLRSGIDGVFGHECRIRIIVVGDTCNRLILLSSSVLQKKPTCMQLNALEYESLAIHAPKHYWNTREPGKC